MSKEPENNDPPILKAKYNKDSKRYHRFSVGDIGDEITGTIYVKKGLIPIPRILTIKLPKHTGE